MTKSEPPATPQTTTLASCNLDCSLGYAIRKAQIRAYQVFSLHMGDMNIRPAQFALLVLIYENPGLRQSSAGNALGIEKANLAGLLTELEQLGAIKRSSLASDRRSYSLHLTAAGRKLVSRLLKRHEQYEVALASGLVPEDKEALLLLLDRLVQD